MTITAKFNGKCARCGGRITAGESIDWSRGTGTRHVSQADCDASRTAAAAAAAQPPVTAEGQPIVEFLRAAQARGLKFPKVRFLAPGGGELRLSVSGPTSRVPGSIQVVVRDEWIGRIEPSGTVTGQLRTTRAVLDELAAIAADPVGKAKAYGALMGRCSFCDSPLTDAGSVEMGYGPVCAKRYGLDHKAKGTPEVKVVPVDAPIVEQSLVTYGAFGAFGE